MIRNRIVRATGLLVLSAAALVLHAQSYYGGVRGIVLDPNGGAIAAAKVTLTDEGTGTQRTTAAGPIRRICIQRTRARDLLTGRRIPRLQKIRTQRRYRRDAATGLRST